MIRMSRSFSLLSFILILSGCASVPFSTMLKLGAMDETDFASIHSIDIRAKIVVEVPVKVDVDKTQISIEVENTQGTIQHKFPLALISTAQIPAEDGFFSDTPARTEYILKFSETAIESFERIQASLLTEQKGQMSLSVGASFDDLPDSVEIIVFSIFLKLSETEAYITLFDEAEIELQR